MMMETDYAKGCRMVLPPMTRHLWLASRHSASANNDAESAGAPSGGQADQAQLLGHAGMVLRDPATFHLVIHQVCCRLWVAPPYAAGYSRACSEASDDCNMTCSVAMAQGPF